MATFGVLQLLLFVVVLIALVKPLGWYMARVYQGGPCGLDKVLGWLERGLYTASGIRTDQEMTWKQYAIALLLFNTLGLLVIYGLQRFQIRHEMTDVGLGKEARCRLARGCGTKMIGAVIR